MSASTSSSQHASNGRSPQNSRRHSGRTRERSNDAFFAPVSQRNTLRYIFLVLAAALTAFGVHQASMQAPSERSVGVTKAQADDQTDFSGPLEQDERSALELSRSGTIAIHRHDELLAALTERAERNRDPALLVRLKPVLIELGQAIDDSRRALHQLYRSRVTGSDEDEAEAQVASRMSAMERVGHRAVRLMTNEDSQEFNADSPRARVKPKAGIKQIRFISSEPTEPGSDLNP